MFSAAGAWRCRGALAVALTASGVDSRLQKLRLDLSLAKPSRPTVFVCRGSSCRHHKTCGRLRECLSAVADLAEVRCQRVCDGPVVGARINGALEWFRRVDTEKARRHIVELVAGLRPLRRSLEKRRVPKRAGALR